MTIEPASKRAAERRMRSMLESAVDYGIIATDLERRIVSWNFGAIRIFGWTVAEVLGQQLDLTFTSEDVEAGAPAAEVQVARASGRAADERWHQRKDGSRFWAVGELMPLFDEAGDVEGYIKIVRDETGRRRATEERERAEEELAATQERLRLALEAAQVIGTYEWDVQTNRMTGDAVFARLFGVDPAAAALSLPADAFAGRIHSDDERRVTDAIARAVETGEPFSSEYRLVRPDGSMSWVLAKGACSRSPDGEPCMFVGALVDITDRKHSEEALREETRRLEILNRTGALLTAELDLQSLLQATTDAGVALTGAQFGAFFHNVINEQGESFMLYTLSGASPEAFESFGMPHNTAVFDPTFRGDGVVRSEDILSDRRYGKSPPHYGLPAGHLPVRSYLAVPVTSRSGEVLGGLFFGHEDPGVFGERDEALVVGVAAQAAVAVDNARLYEAAQRDIAQRRAAEAALRESEARLRLAIDAGRMAVWQVDIRTEAVTGSPELNRLLGFPPDATPTIEEMRSRYCPGERERIQAAGQASLARGDPFIEVEYCVKWPDQSVHWLLMRAEVQFDQSGAPSQAVGVLLDVTERVRAEAALRDLNEDLEAEVAARTGERNQLWALSKDLLAVAGFDGMLKAVNPAWTDVLGYNEAALLSKPFAELIHPDDLAAAGEIIGALQSGEVTQRFEDRLRAADGSYVHVSWTAVPQGDVFYAAGRDVTAERRQQEALRQAEEQLRQAQKMEAVGQLTGGIAHDFNNLLTGIVGSLELLQRRVRAGRTDDIERYASVATTSAQRAAALTQRLLAFARRQPLDPKAVDANRLVAGMEDLLRRTLGPSIDLEMVLAGGLWATLCDPNQLESALLNLAINARDAMPAGGRLTIETANAFIDDAYARALGGEIGAGQYVAISVTDSGEGMPADVIEKAFEPFFTTKPIGQGTGLGLSMLYGFVRQSDGHVRIYSEIDRGTTVKLYLPRHRGDAAADADAQATSGSEGRAHEGETVLVVEDEAAVRMLVTDVLDQLGYAALKAVDGPSGLRVLQSAKRIDLLITDVGLPGLNGRQLADAARELRPDLKVLFITGYAHNAAFGNGVLAHGMELMSKPFALDALAEKVRSMIERTPH
jgi:PAS domain S-box-containing protein